MKFSYWICFLIGLVTGNVFSISSISRKLSSSTPNSFNNWNTRKITSENWTYIVGIGILDIVERDEQDGYSPYKFFTSETAYRKGLVISFYASFRTMETFLQVMTHTRVGKQWLTGQKQNNASLQPGRRPRRSNRNRIHVEAWRICFDWILFRVTSVVARICFLHLETMWTGITARSRVCFRILLLYVY